MNTKPFLTSPPAWRPFVTLMALFVSLLAVSWRRWTSVIADVGRELDLPWRLLNGETLYRDIHYLYPPLAPYLNAGLYRLFGIRLEILQASGVLCSVAVVWLSYRIARHLLPPRESTLAAASVIVLCVFKPTGNLISPYAYASLYALVLGLAALWMILQAAQHRQPAYLCAAGFCIALATLMKLEFAVAAFAALVVYVALGLRSDRRTLLAAVIFSLTPILAIGVLGYSVLFNQHGWALLVEDCHLFFTHLPASLHFYNAQRTGLDHPLFSLWQMLGALSVAVTIACAMAGFSLKSNARLRRRMLWAGLFAFGCATLVLLTAQGRWDGSPLRALPILLLVWLYLNWRAQTAEQTVLLIITVYSLMMLARVALRVPSGGAFGSFFLPTSLILICYGLTQNLPSLLSQWTDASAPNRRAWRFGYCLFALAVCLTAVSFSIRYRRNFTVAITTPRGSLVTTASNGAAYREALDFIATHTQPSEAIAIFPEGSDLAFFSARQMPLRHQIYIPGLVSEKDEMLVIEQLRKRPIRYVFLVNRPMTEFGATAFGQDFSQRLGAYLNQHYRVVRVCGLLNQADAQIGDARFFIKVLAKREVTSNDSTP